MYKLYIYCIYYPCFYQATPMWASTSAVRRERREMSLQRINGFCLAYTLQGLNISLHSTKILSADVLCMYIVQVFGRFGRQVKAEPTRLLIAQRQVLLRPLSKESITLQAQWLVQPNRFYSVQFLRLTVGTRITCYAQYSSRLDFIASAPADLLLVFLSKKQCVKKGYSVFVSFSLSLYITYLEK